MTILYHTTIDDVSIYIEQGSSRVYVTSYPGLWVYFGADNERYKQICVVADLLNSGIYHGIDPITFCAEILG